MLVPVYDNVSSRGGGVRIIDVIPTYTPVTFFCPGPSSYVTTPLFPYFIKEGLAPSIIDGDS